MDPLVSIIIPSYNHSRYIVETLNSVLADTYKNKEIIILDDGSKDDSLLIINTWIIRNSKEVAVRLISRENRGVCKTLNELIELSNGRYILPLASDDLLTNNTITERVKILQQSNRLVLVADAEVIDEQGIVTHSSMLTGFHNAKKENYKTSEGILDEIIFNFAISGAVVMMDKRIFSIVGKYPEDLLVEDFYFYLSTAIKNEIFFWDNVVSQYRWHTLNTSKGNDQLFFEFLKIYRRLFLKIPGVTRKLKVFEQVIRMLIHRSRLYFGLLPKRIN